MRWAYKSFVTLCILFLCACASKELESKISRLETENQVLKNKLKKADQEKATLEEEMTFLKGRTQAFEPIEEQKAVEVKQAQEVVMDDDPDAFFEEDIEAEQETLVFTNEDIEKIQWGSSSIASKPSKKTTSQVKTDYQNAYKAFQEKNYEKSRTLMLAFIDKYPDHDYTDNAHFWIGETYYATGAYQKADVYFKNVIRDFPKGNKVPDAMYRSASCAMRQSKKGIAKQSFEILIQKYPKTVAAGKAKKTLQTLK